MTKITKLLLKDTPFVPAVVCFFIKGNQVLLIHRKQTSSGLGQDLIAGVGGKVGDKPEFKDETSDQAAVRECGEEVGSAPTVYRKVGRVRFIWEGRPAWSMIVDIYVVEAWDGEPKETDVAKPEWFETSALPVGQMWEDNHYWIPRVLSGEKVDAVFLYGPDKTIVEYTFDEVR